MTPPPDGFGSLSDQTITTLCDRILPVFRDKFPGDRLGSASRAEIAREAKLLVTEFLTKNRIDLNLLDQRDLVTALVNGTFKETPAPTAPPAEAELKSEPVKTEPAETPRLAPLPMANEIGLSSLITPARGSSRASVDQAKLKLQPMVL